MSEKNTKNNFIHFLYTPFTGLGLHGGYRGDKWLKNRIKIFKNYTLKSLLNQDNRNFVHWISWRPQERDNPQVIELGRYLAQLANYDFIFTFGGCCFWDDKYPNDNLGQRLASTLPQLREYIDKQAPEAQFVYMTIQPSDDMYDCKMVKLIQEQFIGSSAQVLGFRRGYFLNAQTHQLAEYNPDTIPPFFTIRFRKEVFLNPSGHYAYTGPYKSHENISDNLKVCVLDDVARYPIINVPRSYCVLTHGENISTVWNMPYRGKEITGHDKKIIFCRFGVQETEPTKIRKRPLLILRGIFNRLPFNGLLYKAVKKVYYNK